MGAMIWNFGDPESWSPWLLESWSKGTVMLTYCFAMPKFWKEICTFGEIGNHGD